MKHMLIWPHGLLRKSNYKSNNKTDTQIEETHKNIKSYRAGVTSPAPCSVPKSVADTSSSAGWTASSSRAILATGRIYIPRFVFTSTALTTPESSRIGRITRPRGQNPLGESVSTTRTRSPCWRLRVCDVHFFLFKRLGTYSLSQRLQTWFVTGLSLAPSSST